MNHSFPFGNHSAALFKLALCHPDTGHRRTSVFSFGWAFGREYLEVAELACGLGKQVICIWVEVLDVFILKYDTPGKVRLLGQNLLALRELCKSITICF